MKQWIQKTVIAGTGIAASLVLVNCGSMKSDDDSSGGDSKTANDKEAKVKFLTEVKPLLENYCLRCHNTDLLLGDLNLETRKLAFTSGKGGPFIIPGQPEASKFYQVLKLQEGNKEAMPPEKHRMTKEERELIYRWIKQGADWPKDSRGTLKPMKVSPTVAMVSGVQ